MLGVGRRERFEPAARSDLCGLALTRCTLPSTSRLGAPRTKVRWSGLRAAVHPKPGGTVPPVITIAANPTQSAVARKLAASQFVTGSCLLRILANVASPRARQERVAQCSARAGLASGSTRATRHPQAEGKKLFAAVGRKAVIAGRRSDQLFIYREVPGRRPAALKDMERVCPAQTLPSEPGKINRARVDSAGLGSERCRERPPRAATNTGRKR